MELSIDRGHEHALISIQDIVRTDGIRDVRSKCSVCGLEERRSFTPEGAPHVIQYRLNGGWINPVDLLRLDLPVQICGGCDGEGCSSCAHVGVLERGGLSKVSPPG